MDLDQALAQSSKHELGGVERDCKLLSVRQLSELRQVVPGLTGAERVALSWVDLCQWVSNDPLGATTLLSLSTGVKVDDLESWGGIIGRASLAARIYSDSIVSGEEPKTDEAKKTKDPITETG